MNSVLYGLDNNALTVDEIKAKMNERLDLLEDDERLEMENDVLEILDSLNDDTFVTTPVYKLMGLLPDVYFLDVHEQTQLLVKIGKTIDNLLILNEVV